MVWSTIKCVPQKYHNFVVVCSENGLKAVTCGERKNAMKRHNIRILGLVEDLLKYDYYIPSYYIIN